MRSLHDYIGIPYVLRGDPPKGADCYTLVKHYANLMLGQHWPEYMYDIRENFDEASQCILAEITEPGGRWRKVENRCHGDMLIFRFRGQPIHCGVYIGLDDNLMLHTMKGRMSCLEPLAHWMHNLVGSYRWGGE